GAVDRDRDDGNRVAFQQNADPGLEILHLAAVRPLAFGKPDQAFATLQHGGAEREAGKGTMARIDGYGLRQSADPAGQRIAEGDARVSGPEGPAQAPVIEGRGHDEGV